MHYNVPQFIDIEDTIVGPLTAKQILWIFAMSGIILIMWLTMRDSGLFFVLAIPIAVIFLALAFYKPQGQPLIKFLTHASMFLVRPKIYIWRREGETRRAPSRKKKENLETGRVVNKESIKQTEIIELAKILDSESDIIKK